MDTVTAQSSAPWPLETEPDPPRYADKSAEEIEDAVSFAPTADASRPRDDLPADRHLDGMLSWLDFNTRVLELAEDPEVPLLERVRFTAIFSRNLDEFFMVRVAALRRRIAAGIAARNSAGLTPRERLERVSAKSHDLAERQHALCAETLLPALAKDDVHILGWSNLDEDELARMRTLFVERIYPVLTPLAVDPAHPFPYISGLSLNLAVVVRDEDGGAEHFARIKVPPLLPRFVATGDDESRFVPLEAVIAGNLDVMFPGVRVMEASTFRVTRNEDLEVDSEAGNLLHALERELSRRRFGAPVRLEVDCDVSDRVLDLLVRELDVTPNAVYTLPAPLDLAGLWALSEIDRPELHYPGFVPETHPALQAPEGGAADIFAAMRADDVLLHHPYDSFTTSVQAFIEQAASDPAVQAIKLTLYRTSGESAIVDSLVDAARSGKQVLVVVEIKARFDEQANIRWARKLEQAGCHVVYGLVGLKTHCKLFLVVRSEKGGAVLRRYVHVGTGNYHPKTARVYEDLGLLTADPDVGADVADLFNHLSGYTRHRDYETLLVAPDMVRQGLVDRIGREAAAARAGRPAGVSIKVNSLVDETLIDALYDASAAGVPVDLLVRGMCSLRPGVPGLSETVRVRSLLGRFLEHSRVFRFAADGEGETWIGSADLRDRNLDRRVEALVRVGAAASRAALDDLLAFAWSDEVDHWSLHGDGSWSRADSSPDGERLADYQQELIRRRRRLAVSDDSGLA
ncbi:MAG: RNA degradosome polyphosphate kinase [Propionibacteriales bacterium]|nr:RNA degradosome polyphosphate kinase [Propionibacteriales bacterium]